MGGRGVAGWCVLWMLLCVIVRAQRPNDAFPQCPYFAKSGQTRQITPNVRTPKQFIGQYLQATPDGKNMISCGYGINGWAGACFVWFRKDDGSYGFRQRIMPGDPQRNAYFGLNLHLRDNVMYIGAPFQNHPRTARAGAAYVFEKKDGTWIETAKIQAPQPQRNGYFGYSGQVAPSGNRLLVGSRWKNNVAKDLIRAGAVYHYARTPGGPWRLVQVIVGQQASAQFSDEIRVEGGLLLVGSPRAYSTRGGAFVYRLGADGRYSLLQELRPEVPPPLRFTTRGHFGEGLAISKDRKYIIVGGERLDSPLGKSSGALYIWKRNPATTRYEFFQPLFPTMGGSVQRYAQRISYVDNFLAVGAWLARPTNSTARAGVVYLYHACAGGKFRQRNVLAMRGGRSGDNFGKNLFLTKTELFVGVPKRDRNPSRTNDDAGAIYAFPYRIVCPSGRCTPLVP